MGTVKLYKAMALVGNIFLFLSFGSLTFCQTNITGLGAAGGNGGLKTAEFWAKMPQEVHCSLPSFPDELYDPTLDLLQDRLIACYERKCYQLEGGEWIVWATTAEVRKYHTSAVTEEGLLLVGGTVEPTRTEGGERLPPAEPYQPTSPSCMWLGQKCW